MLQYKIHNNNRYTDVVTDNFIEITSGGFEGVHFNFGKIEFTGDDEESTSVKYDYNLLYIPENIIIDVDRPLLERELGRILEDILEKMVPKNETGTADTESTTEG